MISPAHNLQNSLRADAVLASEGGEAFARGMTYLNETIAFAWGQSYAKILLEIGNEEEEALRQQNVRRQHSLLC